MNKIYKGRKIVRGKVKAQAKDRDGPVFYDDSVEVFLKPPEAKSAYLHLAVNTAGVQFDQRIFDTAWNADWQAACKVLPDSWTAEIAIPFAALAYLRPVPGTTWGINLARNRTISGEIETLVWSVPYGTLHSPGRFGTATFE